MPEIAKCQVCKEDISVRIELTVHNSNKAQSKAKFCIPCWNKYYRPGIGVVTELLEGRNET